MGKENKKIAEFKEKLSLFYDKVGALTKVQRLLICLSAFALIGGAYYYFIFSPKQKTLTQVKQIYDSQVEQLASYKKKAALLGKYERLMAEAQGEFNIAMKALPDKRELPSLLTGISRAGGDAGLIFHLFKPGNEVNHEFYKMLPVSIKVEGRYHQLTDFFHQIIRLNRIVNINNIDLKSQRGGQSLSMSCQAVTYMFVEKQKPKGGKKRKR